MKNIKVYEDFNASNDNKIFTDANIAYYVKMWNSLNIKYANNPFFLSLFNKMKSKKYLSQKQWAELEYLFKNGISRYEAGILPKNN
jgi:hypothetical protein